MPIGITIIAACLAFGGAIVGRVRIARARARVRARLAGDPTPIGALEIGALVKVVGRVRLAPAAAEAPLSGRRCAAWEVALTPGRGPKVTVALHGGRDFEVVGDEGEAIAVAWDPSAEILLGEDLRFRYGRSVVRGDARASAVTAALDWSGDLGARPLPTVGEFQRRFAALLGLADLYLPPPRGALVGEERALVEGQVAAVLGVVRAGSGGAREIAGAAGLALALASEAGLAPPAERRRPA